MLSNAMTKCAVGATLFGGTLGAVSTAQAAIGDPQSVVFSATSYSNIGLRMGIPQFSGGTFSGTLLPEVSAQRNILANSDWSDPLTAASGNQSVTYGGGLSDFSGIEGQANPSSRSFSFSADLAGTNPDWIGAISLYEMQLDVVGTVLITLSINTSATDFTVNSWYFGTYAGWVVQDAGFSSIASLAANQAGPLNVQLTTGTYYLSFTAFVAPGFEGNVATFSVPAPGAVALLGAAGLIGRRRRRA